MVPESMSTQNLTIVTFNCKNVNTSKHLVDRLAKSTDFILLQEHWLFDCQLASLKEIQESFTGIGKAVDSTDPILPVQMPRGYGGVAILWKKNIDHLVSVLPDGGNRIQCVTIRAEKLLLLVSIYMPCKGVTDNHEAFADCLDQLNEILLKYGDTHSILLGGDFNEDLAHGSARRSNSLKEFLTEHSLITKATDKTFIHPNGTDSSTIDYIFYQSAVACDISSIVKLDLPENNSDHYPIKCVVTLSLDRAISNESKAVSSQRVNWKKVDVESYRSNLVDLLSDFTITSTSISGLDNSVMKFNGILQKAAEIAGPTKVRRMRKPKLVVWSPEIRLVLAEKKKAFAEWKLGGRPDDPCHPLLIMKREAKQAFRRVCRNQVGTKQREERQEILDAKVGNVQLFHKLIRKQRGKLSGCINELYVSDNVYKGENVLEGWFEHFKRLSTESDDPSFDQDYHRLVLQEVTEIEDICQAQGQLSQPVNVEEVKRAIKQLNRGKAADAMGITAEHFIHADETLLDVLCTLLNRLFQAGQVTDSMKTGLVTPVFKKKGSNTNSKNYRGITVIPIFTKILELVIRDRIKPLILGKQNKLQRGFTENSSPMNTALILEEYIRDRQDSHMPAYIAFLDVKSAFDVVSHQSLMRKLFHIGVEGNMWTLISSLHQDAKSAVKWQGQISEKFCVEQGVRQGGILSTDLYKIYGDSLLDRLSMARNATKIGPVICVAPTCADDCAVGADTPELLQSLLDIGVDSSKMERYILQPVKSVILEILNKPRKCSSESNTTWDLDGAQMPKVDKTMHVGICRSSDTGESAVAENVKKARRTMYSLMSAGLHGENGLEPVTSLHLYQIYVLPVLLYGMEVVFPRPKYIEVLEKFNKQNLKHIMSLPVTTADPAVYILSGNLPVEAMIHQRVLNFFGNISRLPDSSVERQLSARQLAVKTLASNSWFVAVRKLCIMYGLPDCVQILGNPPTKVSWKTTVRNAICGYWAGRLRSVTPLYPSLRWMSSVTAEWPSRHPLLESTGNLREVPRIAVHLKIVTGTYILQTNRQSFNQNQVNPMCLLCKNADETMAHFLLNCTTLENTRQPILRDIKHILRDCALDLTDSETLLQLIIDCTAVLDIKFVRQVIFHIRRLCFALHIERYKGLSLVPRRKRNKKT